MSGIRVPSFEPASAGDYLIPGSARVHEARPDIIVEPAGDMNAVKITMGGVSRVVIGPSLVYVIEQVLREARPKGTDVV